MMEFNRNLVICSISLGRMQLIDKLYFKEEFPGNIYIIMDDRNPISAAKVEVVGRFLIKVTPTILSLEIPFA